MRKFFIIVLLAAATVMIAGQKNLPVPNGRIEGVILDGASSQPLAGVIVAALQEKDTRNVTTDAQGRFTFTLPYGTVRLLASKDGYAALRPEGHRYPTDGLLLSVGPSQQLRGLKLKIFQNGFVTGTVYDGRAKAVQYARAQLLRNWYDDNGDRSLLPVATGKGGDTNDHGEFRIDGVDPGEYVLQVTPPILAEREPGEPFVTAKPVNVTIKSGAGIAIADVTLPSVRGSSIRIHLVNQTGETIQNTLNKYLRWMSRDTPATSVVIPLLIMGGPERAEIPLPPGTYDVVAGWSRGNAPPIGLGRRTVNLTLNSVNLELPVTKGVPVTIQAPGAVKCDLNSDIFGRVAILDNVQPGIYRVACTSLPADSYTDKIQQGDRDVLKDGLQVDSAGNNTAVVTISNVVGTVEGSVADAKGVKATGVLVVFVPDVREAQHLYRTISSDQNGAFSLKTVPPGSYRVFAWTELEGAAYKNDAFMKRFETEGTPVKVEKGGKLSVTVKLLDVQP